MAMMPIFHITLKLILKNLEPRLMKKERLTIKNSITFKTLLQISRLHRKFRQNVEKVEKHFLAVT